VDWLIDETTTPTKRELEAEVVDAPHLRGKSSAALAIRLNDVVVHDVRKWFFGADLRLDAIVIDGGGNTDEKAPFYQPSTARFPGVKDGDRLPIYEPGLLVFWGRPRHFLDVSIMVSRDRKDTEDLAVLIGEVAHSDDWRDLSATIGTLAAGAPPVAAVMAAIQSAGALATAAMKLLNNITGSTVGLYRTHYLQRRDRFGLGRHPTEGTYRERDLSFWYDVVLDRAEPPA
jgi:hypothetical protein